MMMMRLVVVLVLIFTVFGLVGGQRGRPRPTFHRCNWCGVNARCVARSACRCPRGMEAGSAYFLCYNAALRDVCLVTDDPVVTTENHETFGVSSFNSSLLMDKVIRTKRKKVSGSCRLRIVESRERSRGKSLPQSLRVRIDLKSASGSPVCSTEFNVLAGGDPNGDAQWLVESGETESGGDSAAITLRFWRTFTSEDMYKTAAALKHCQCRIYFQVTAGRILRIKVNCCKHTIGFRPFIKKIPWLKAGYFFMSKERTVLSLPPGPLPRNLPLCLRRGFSVDSVAAKLGLENLRHAMTYVALTNLPPGPGGLVGTSPAQIAMRDAIFQCSAMGLQNLFQQANFMMNSAPFIREISSGTQGYRAMMEMVKRAADYFCKGDVGSCQSILADIDTYAKELVNRYPKLAAFVANNCSP